MFLCYEGCRVVMPNGPSVVQCLIFKGSRIVRPNGHFFYLSNVDVQLIVPVRPNGCFLFIVQLGHAEWPSLLCCSMSAVQRVLSGSADWPFCRSMSDVQ